MSLVLSVQQDSGIPDSPMRSNQIFRWIAVGQTLVVGRSPQWSDMVIPDDPRISSKHFQIECNSDRSLITDLDSSNGTFVNQQMISSARLAHDDYILAGGTRFHVHLPNAGGVTATARADRLAKCLENEDIELDGTMNVEDSNCANMAGWDIELSEWPEPLSAEIQQHVFEQFGNAPSDPPNPIANVVLMIHDDSPIAQDRCQSRAIAWISPDQALVVGRSSTHSDWAIAADTYMSSRHFRISNADGICRLDNLSGTNGTRVNGKKLESTLLRDQDLICAGRTVLQVGIKGGVELSDKDIQIAAVRADGT